MRVSGAAARMLSIATLIERALDSSVEPFSSSCAGDEGGRP